MARGDLDKRVKQLEHQVVKSQPQKPVKSIIVDESNYLEKEAEILQAEQDGIEIIVIHTFDGKRGAEPSEGYAEYIKRSARNGAKANACRNRTDLE